MRIKCNIEDILAEMTAEETVAYNLVKNKYVALTAQINNMSFADKFSNNNSAAYNELCSKQSSLQTAMCNLEAPVKHRVETKQLKNDIANNKIICKTDAFNRNINIDDLYTVVFANPKSGNAIIINQESRWVTTVTKARNGLPQLSTHEELDWNPVGTLEACESFARKPKGYYGETVTYLGHL